MTPAEARIAVRMLGILLIGLCIPPTWSSLLALSNIVQIETRSGFMTQPMQWTWVAGLVLRAVLFPLAMLFGFFLIKRADRTARIIFPECWQ